MAFTADSGNRNDFITGLRDLANYLASHPAVPVPRYGTEIYLSASSTDDGGCAEVDHFARQLDITPVNSVAHNGHYQAARCFGPIGYRMLAISQAAMARHLAADTYYGCVTPDTWT
jgi:hypothetical protein